ncbi:MAG TPA: ATP-binding cassette domain-containing protein [Vicinamibacterales bacterium]|nr:ATP-binding cassette domain-containing protein [Vicinamibacterales bacterium]
MEPVLELVNATLIRGRTRVLDDLSLTIHKGEHTVILGPNGAGKTSLIRMLTLDDRPRTADNGTPPLRLFGREDWDVTELRTRLGVVTGDLDASFGIYTSGGRVSGLDTAISGLFGSHGVFSHHDVTPAMREQGQIALARVEAPHLAGKPLSEMSAGERRRVLIARALVTRPDTLVLDEPTTGLDFVARHRFMETVRRLTHEGTTLILITHHVDEIVPETRRVVLLREGRIAYQGSPADALTAARLSDVFGAPLTVERSGDYYHVKVAT